MGSSRALPVFLEALVLGGGAVEAMVNTIADYQWIADGLTLAGKNASRSRIWLFYHNTLPIRKTCII